MIDHYYRLTKMKLTMNKVIIQYLLLGKNNFFGYHSQFHEFFVKHAEKFAKCSKLKIPKPTELLIDHVKEA